ncbi:MAG: putative enzyme related to lactoylglutathione lyase, partial [Bradymonadia bacterium]
KDTQATKQWYIDNLGFEPDKHGYVMFESRQRNADIDEGLVWSPFSDDTGYFDPGKQEFMVNYIVDDLDGMREQLKAAGVTVIDEVEEMDTIGRFGWAIDNDGRKFEMWEPERKPAE